VTASVVDVAEAILSRHEEPLSTFSLHKLVVYAQAYHLAFHGEPLFTERIEAWVNGPAVPDLYRAHVRAFAITTVRGDPDALNAGQRESIDRILAFYGGHPGDWLVAQTHLEAPWLRAREGLGENERGNREITVGALRDYYKEIFNDPAVEDAYAAARAGTGLTSDELRARYGA
jgi:uncharacterized phage-associated protein